MSRRLRRVVRVPRLPPRPRDAHKGTFGRVLVIGGSRGMIGAPALCANAALRSGAGLVRVAIEGVLHAEVALLAPCATTIPFGYLSVGAQLSGQYRLTRDERRELQRYVDQAWTILDEAFARNDVVAVGPGWGVENVLGRYLRHILEATDKPVIVDADGLNNLAQIRSWWKAVEKRVKRGGPVVLTPHPGEMQRLLDSAKINRNAKQERMKSARELAEQSGAVVIHKGAGTIVTDAERVYVNKTGNPGMATGGSGDVLTGVIAALIGQGMPPFDAAVLGVYVHGLAGDLAARKLGEISLTAGDLLDYLPAAFLRTHRRR